jgi:hypothetical protein
MNQEYRVVALKYQERDRTQYYGVQTIKVADSYPAIYQSVYGPDTLVDCNKWIADNSVYEWDDFIFGPKWIHFLLTHWLAAFLVMLIPTVLLAVFVWIIQWHDFDSFYFVVSVGAAVAAALYTLWPAKVAPTLRYLLENGRFKEKSGLTSAEFIHDFQAKLSHPLHTLWFWFTIIIGAGLLFVFNALHKRGLFHGLVASTDIMFDLGRALHWLIIPTFIWILFGAFGISALGTVSKFINKLSKEFEIDVAPWHPDKSGGFAVLSELNMLMALPVLLATFLLGFYSIFGTAWLPSEDESNCETQSTTTEQITEYVDGSVETLTQTLSSELCPPTATTEHEDEISAGTKQDSTILEILDMTPKEAIINFTTIGVIILLVLLVGIFGIPMWNIHLEMVKEKNRYENKHALEADRLQEFIESKQLPGEAEGVPSIEIPDEVTKAQERLDNLKEKLAAYPTWPVPVRIRAVVLTSNIPALLGLILNLDTISESILKRLFGVE